MVLAINGSLKTHYNKNQQRKFSKNNGNNLNFKAVKFLEISNKYKHLEKNLLEETKQFVKNNTNTRSIGKGVFSEVFRFNKFKDIVIKRPFGADDLQQEANILKELPSSLSASQQFVALAFDDVGRKHYLLSTLVEGSAPDPKSQPWTKNSLKSLFTGMFELDKAGIYHGDLNNGNLKINRYGDVNFIDFQWGTKTNLINFYENNSTQLLPNFIPIQNSQMFEMAEIPYYLKQVDAPRLGKRFLVEYLGEKSRYHKARLSNIYATTQGWVYSSEIPHIEKAKKYESAQEEVYRSSSNTILNLETLKIQFLSAFREASKYLDPNTIHKNIIPAGTSYIYTLSSIQALRKKLAENQSNSYGKMGEYLKGLTEYADYWFNNLKSWTKDAFYYPFRHTQAKLEKWETLHNFNDPEINIEYFDDMTNVTELVDKNFEVAYVKNFDCDTKDVGYYMNEIDRCINLTKNNSIAKNHSSYQGLIKAYDKLKKAFNEKRWLDVINNSLLLMRRCHEMNYFSSCENIQRYSAILSEGVFKDVYDDVVRCGPNYYTFPGYKGMNELR